MGHVYVNTKRKWSLNCVFIKEGSLHDGYWDLFFEHGNFRLCFYLCVYPYPVPTQMLVTFVNNWDFNCIQTYSIIV